MKQILLATKIALGISLVTMIFVPFARAQDQIQRQTNIQALQQLSQKFRQRSEAKKAEAVRVAKEHGWPVRKEFPDGRVIEIQEIREDGKPIYYTTYNLNAAKTVSTNKLWPGGSSGLNLTGSGITLGEWDGGGVRTTHQEFGGRVTQKDSPSSTGGHATHVAGTLIAAGVYSDAKGMSYQANLDAYDWNSDQAEMAAAASAGLRASNHSYGYHAGWVYNGLGDDNWAWWGDPPIDPTEDWKFGFYSPDDQNLDQIAYDAPYYLIVKSAGNDRGDGPTPGTGHWVWDGSWVWSTDGRDFDGYDCIPYEGVGKNILTVGAVNDIPGGYTNPSDVVMSSFSGWGPADDGRIKPDIVGNGIGLVSTYSTSDNSYAPGSGTSMASPNVCGSLGLLIQHYQGLHGGSSMRAATLKALVIHTADEAGPTDGPDYMFGWGLLNSNKAAEVISQDSTGDSTMI